MNIGGENRRGRPRKAHKCHRKGWCIIYCRPHSYCGVLVPSAWRAVRPEKSASDVFAFEDQTGTRMQQADYDNVSLFEQEDFLNYGTEGYAANITQDIPIPDLPVLGEQNVHPPIQPLHYRQEAGSHFNLPSAVVKSGPSRAQHVTHTHAPQIRSYVAQNDVRSPSVGNGEANLSAQQNSSSTSHSKHPTRTHGGRLNPAYEHDSQPIAHQQNNAQEVYRQNSLHGQYQNHTTASAAAPQTKPLIQYYRSTGPNETSSRAAGNFKSPTRWKGSFKVHSLLLKLQEAENRITTMENQLMTMANEMREVVRELENTRNESCIQQASVVSRADFDQFRVELRDYRDMTMEVCKAVETMNATDMPGDTVQVFILTLSDMMIKHERLTGPPEPERYDRRVRKAKGTSFALDMRPEKLERSKMNHAAHTERYLQVMRINGAYRRELVFFRACFEPSRELIKDVSATTQQLVLHQYYHPAPSQAAEDEMNELIAQILQAVAHYEAIIKAAENDWVGMTEQEAKCARAEFF